MIWNHLVTFIVDIEKTLYALQDIHQQIHENLTLWGGGGGGVQFQRADSNNGSILTVKYRSVRTRSHDPISIFVSSENRIVWT